MDNKYVSEHKIAVDLLNLWSCSAAYCTCAASFCVMEVFNRSNTSFASLYFPICKHSLAMSSSEWTIMFSCIALSFFLSLCKTCLLCAISDRSAFLFASALLKLQ